MLRRKTRRPAIKTSHIYLYPTTFKHSITGNIKAFARKYTPKKIDPLNFPYYPQPVWNLPSRELHAVHNNVITFVVHSWQRVSLSQLSRCYKHMTGHWKTSNFATQSTYKFFVWLSQTKCIRYSQNIKRFFFVIKMPYVFYESGTERLDIILTVRQDDAHHIQLGLNSVITSCEGLNILCPHKWVSL
jgi:hypothetical protein